MPADFLDNRTLWIGADIRCVHLEKIGLDVVAGLSRTTPTDDQTFRLTFLFSGSAIFSQRQTFRFGQQDILRKVGSMNGSISFISHRAVPYSAPRRYFRAFLDFWYTINHSRAPQSISHQQVKRMQAGQGIGKGFPDFKERPKSLSSTSPPDAMRYACASLVAIRPTRIYGKAAFSDLEVLTFGIFSSVHLLALVPGERFCHIPDHFLKFGKLLADGRLLLGLAFHDFTGIFPECRRQCVGIFTLEKDQIPGRLVVEASF